MDNDIPFIDQDSKNGNNLNDENYAETEEAGQETGEYVT